MLLTVTRAPFVPCGDHNHHSVGERDFCLMAAAQEIEQHRSEMAAERAATRYFEEGPHGPVDDDPFERAKQAADEALRHGEFPDSFDAPPPGGAW